ncbi:DUF5709 domain-containing protein [Streptomyces sp. NPDC056480]|uniref:DUF5709 domain-containing protein n=1 Tax=Streptomyces sp. NPDC056480 TaxID=3345833 RepID=UPI0036983ED1
MYVGQIRQEHENVLTACREKVLPALHGRAAGPMVVIWSLVVACALFPLVYAIVLATGRPGHGQDAHPPTPLKERAMARNESHANSGSDQPEQNDARGDDVYQPAPSDAAGHSADLDPDNALMTDAIDDLAVPGYSPPERPRGVTRHGTTQREQQEGESLDERLAQEMPDAPGEPPPEDDGIGDLPGGAGEPVDEQAGATRAGRLAPVDTPPGRDDHAVARDVGLDDGSAPAEEAAMHVDTAVDENSERATPSDDGTR